MRPYNSDVSKTLISILGGLGGMFGWGTSDFFANLSSEKIGNFKTFLWSQVIGVFIFLITLLVVRPSFLFSPFVSFLMVIAAFGYGVGYIIFYRAFEVGNVSVVSGMINVGTVVAMIVAFFVFGQRLGVMQFIGIVMVLIGATMVAVDFKDLSGGKAALAKGAKESLIASVLFGLFYWPVNEYITEHSHWLSSSIAIKLISLAIILGIAFWQKRDLQMKNTSKKIWLFICLVGILEALGVLATSFGVSVGDSIIIAPISSALTIVTVMLAIIFLKEKVSFFRGLGIIMTVIGIILTAL